MYLSQFLEDPLRLTTFYMTRSVPQDFTNTISYAFFIFIHATSHAQPNNTWLRAQNLGCVIFPILVLLRKVYGEEEFFFFFEGLEALRCCPLIITRSCPILLTAPLSDSRKWGHGTLWPAGTVEHTDATSPPRHFLCSLVSVASSRISRIQLTNLICFYYSFC